MQKHEKKDDSSVCRSEFWGICCESGKRYSQVVCKKFHISMAALDPTGNNATSDTLTSPCVSLMVERDGCQYLLCSLKPDSILQVILNLYFDKGENITFFLKGHGTVHLSGYYVYDESDAGSTENSRKGQLSSLAKKGGKKHQTSFTVSADVESSGDEDSSEVEEVKLKDLPKGKAVSPVKKLFTPTFASPKKGIATIISKKDTSEDDSSEDDDSEDEPDDKTKDSKKLTTYAMKRVHSTVESEEEESSDDDDDDSDGADLKADIANIKKKIQNNKKFKAEALTPVQTNKVAKKTPIKPAVIDLENDAKFEKPDLNSSIGRTPMPKKPALTSVQKAASVDSFLAEMKAKSKSPKKESSDSDDEMETSITKTPEKPANQLDTSAQSESAKKKKKKKKNKAAATPENQQDVINKSPSKQQQQFSNKLPSGIEYDDVRIGNGLSAKKGKLVHVYYTGKLENNKVFDSCQQGSKPFSFKLASGQVIKGWDLGIEGMKVGGKRRLKIPPKLGYANQRMGDIPPNSTLYFVVELKAVS